MLNNFFQNTRKPKGLAGKMIVRSMNKGHVKLAQWGISHLNISSNPCILDIGCGGGANISKFLKEYPKSKVFGIDYSTVSVNETKKLNSAEIENGRCTVKQGNVLNIPFEDSKFNLVTAFETVYFWPDLKAAFAEVNRVLKPNSTFFICNEVTNPDDDKWSKIIDGMNVYTNIQLKESLNSCGFVNISIYSSDKRGWGCIVAHKK